MHFALLVILAHATPTRLNAKLGRTTSLSSTPIGLRTNPAPPDVCKVKKGEECGLGQKPLVSKVELQSKTSPSSGLVSQCESLHPPAIKEDLGKDVQEPFTFPLMIRGIMNPLGGIDTDSVAQRIKFIVKASLDLENRLLKSLATGECVVGTEETCIANKFPCPVQELAHKLFQSAHSQFVDFFLNQADLTLNYLEVLMFGHSIGGGLAQILALRMYYEPIYKLVKSGSLINVLNQLKVIAFASPRVFDSDWKEFPVNVYHALHSESLLPPDMKVFGKVIEVEDREEGLAKSQEHGCGFARKKEGCLKKTVSDDFQNWWTLFHSFEDMNDFIH